MNLCVTDSTDSTRTLTITHLSLFFLVSIQKLTPDDSIQAEELLGASCVWCVCVCTIHMCEYV